MKKLSLFTLLSIIGLCNACLIHAQTLSLRDVKSYPFPTSLTAAATGNKIAWAFDEQGKRNVYVAEAPDFKARKLTDYNEDDGQEISSLSISADGNWVVFLRGGDHGSNWNDEAPVNVNASPEPPKVQIHALSFDGKQHIVIGEGENPILSPKSDQVLFTRKGQAWIASLAAEPLAKQLFQANGITGEMQWSPKGNAIAFVSNRSDHSFIGIYTDKNTAIKWLSPSFNRDRSPRWSPDGDQLAFVRTPGRGGATDSILSRKHQPWAIWNTDLKTMEARQVWKAPQTLAGSPPTTQGGTNLNWGTGNRILFVSAQDGWSHLYSIPAAGGPALLLTPGEFMAEHIVLSPDKKWLYFSANTGKDSKDIDRRHIARVPVNKAAMEVISEGTNLEWTPAITGDSKYITFITSIGQQPPLPAVIQLDKLKQFNKEIKLIAKENIPASFPTSLLTAPKQVFFHAPDGLLIHAQLFEGKGKAQKKPAIIYIHGGPSRQMLLGWNYSEYYTNAYAMNQYLASLGFTVLSVNYRMGIGYGYEFQNAPNCGTKGAAEYQDIKSAGLWLSKQQNIDASRIGVYGGSYGGYLTNMALAKDSKLFAAGVSIHSMGDLTLDNDRRMPERFEKAPDAELALKTIWESSPVAHIGGWTSPVMLIHGDDDRNVHFSQSTDLNKRLLEKGIEVSSLVIVDDTHHWMKYENVMKVNQAVADFFSRKLMP
ncbi:S9 family peptidase [Pedobacter heparinus]|uniref:Acyl-peptide hydrolase n=1 Tax=Pedobacter heparinus (strain ATCC 13125 / DSM 2366 / CIP 104194 / JCM 7457 / NBRC 12017 / NCIMB 9290 / NRRL B-14731 / HIM 762-3) TaxID=485917 RepID=C6XYR8_PEDHD|nr:prolyl oligopeptidase family serine peptidase [Pedobacter heparinus]ACU04550.1 peptidase S9 prolyl oligopeptidase active site domain protein [Pedobacter heparinus DSM 2366]